MAGVGRRYHSPHKFRHGHAVYALRMAQDVAALKAVSQNLMHQNLTVTDGVYGVLSDVDVKRQIGLLGVTPGLQQDKNIEELRSLLRELTARLK
jgi:integrase